MTSTSSKGQLIVFEGADGCGKTTLAGLFTGWLLDQGLRAKLLAFPGAEVGSLGRHVYALHHSPEDFDIRGLAPASLQLLHIAAHLDAIDSYIRPALASGITVVLDRFWWSTWVYGRVGGVAPATLDAMIELERTHWAEDLPIAVFLMDRRIPLRTEPMSLWHRLVEEYKSLAAQEASRGPVFTVANEGNPEDALAQVTAQVGQRFCRGGRRC